MTFKEEFIVNVQREGAGHARAATWGHRGHMCVWSGSRTRMRGARGPWNLSEFPQTGRAGQQRAWERLLEQFYLWAIGLALG